MSTVRTARRSVGDRAPAILPFVASRPVPQELPPGSVTVLQPSAPAPARQPLDIAAIRAEFPALREQVGGRPLVWLDNAATTQKPRSVIARITAFYEHENSNVHRAAHTLARRASDAYEGARENVRRFINAPLPRDIVFVRGATEAINLVAQTWGRQQIGAGDEILVTELEHHSNIVPWQMLAAERRARLRVVPIDGSGQIDLDAYVRLLTPKTRLVAVTQISNALGTVTPLAEMIRIAHEHGARVLVDGAQGVAHMPVDVRALDADFYVFSGHKMFGPMGIGVLYGKSELLDAAPPWQYGGNMIAEVHLDSATFQAAPARFEAGTAHVAGAVALGAAIDYLDRIGLDNVTAHERALTTYGAAQLAAVDGVQLLGSATDRAGILSFVVRGLDAAAVGAALDEDGIAVRAGHHCAQPALRRFALGATVRASLAVYNTGDEIDALVASLERLLRERDR